MLAQAFIADNDRVLMVKQAKHGREFWNFPGGHLLAGETPRATCVREVGEETGYDVQITKCLGRQQGKLTFLADITGGTPQLEPGLLAMDWVDFNDFEYWDATTRPVLHHYRYEHLRLDTAPLPLQLSGRQSVSVVLLPYAPTHGIGVKELVLANQEELGFSYDERMDADLDDIGGRYQECGGFWVALHEQSLVGTCGLMTEGRDRARLKRLHVARPYRGRRIGLSLLDHVIGIARLRGFQRLVLDTTPRQQRAIDLYRRYGFKLVDEQPAQLTFHLSLGDDGPRRGHWAG